MDGDIALVVGGTSKESLEKPVWFSMIDNLKRQRKEYFELLFHCVRFTKVDEVVHIKAGVDWTLPQG